MVSLGPSTICPKLPDRVRKIPAPIRSTIKTPALSSHVRSLVLVLRGSDATGTVWEAGLLPGCDGLLEERVRLEPDASLCSTDVPACSVLVGEAGAASRLSMAAAGTSDFDGGLPSAAISVPLAAATDEAGCAAIGMTEA